jgi:TPR repeat protein
MRADRSRVGLLVLAGALLLGASGAPEEAAPPETAGAEASAHPAPAPEQAAAMQPTEPEAQFQLAARYLVGRDGVPKDPSQSVVWFRKAAEQGHLRAQAQLGMAYYLGRGTPTNLLEALRWLNIAAERGHPRAQLQLAIAHRDGVGVAKDEIRALMWFELAAQSGSIPARLMFSGVAAKNTPERRRQAHLMALEWREEHGLELPQRPEEPGEAAEGEHGGPQPASAPGPDGPAAGAAPIEDAP